MSAARRVLERLLRRAESARLRADPRPASLSMGSATDYLRLRTLDELERFHAEIALAEREGAIVAVREHRHGDGNRLLRLQVADALRLARHLGTDLLDERVDAAASLLRSWTTHFPIIDEVLQAWRQGRKVRGRGADAAVELGDAAHAVAALADESGHERVLRRESARLFGSGHSKRLESLTPWLDLLVSADLEASGLEKEHVWASIGLRREPQPMLFCGDGTVQLIAGQLPLLRPFIGLPVDAVQQVSSGAGYLLSIENLASFHDATRAAGAEGGLLLYTGGMPSPAWRAAYARILRGLAPTVAVHHWGDIDEGGFRIAAVLAETAAAAGCRLQPWLMSPASVAGRIPPHLTPPAPAVLHAMCRWAERAGWGPVADELRAQPLHLEQELLEPAFPAPPDRGIPDASPRPPSCLHVP